jgi:hypothetical protein
MSNKPMNTTKTAAKNLGIGKVSPIRDMSQSEIIDKINIESSRKAMHDLAAKQTDSRTVASEPRMSVLLSTGHTVAHERMNNGAQHAYVIGSENGAMTEAEWTEYCQVIKS